MSFVNEQKDFEKLTANHLLKKFSLFLVSPDYMIMFIKRSK